jgi:hypothetical protein
MFHNYLVFTVAHSLGLFEQRVKYYSAAVAVNPARAANAFLDRLGTVHGWATRPLTEVAADVQMPRVDLRGAYAKWQPRRSRRPRPPGRRQVPVLSAPPDSCRVAGTGPGGAQPLSCPVWPLRGSVAGN